MTEEPTPHDKELANFIADAFGTRPKIFNYYDESEQNNIHIASSENCPVDGVTSFATIGLYNYPISDAQDNSFQHGVELVAAGGSTTESLSNIVATAAFNVMKDKWPCYPGALFPDMLKMYNTSETLSHILLTSPFLWENRLNKTIDIGDKKVTFLLLIPISEGEMAYAEKHGSDKLEELLEANNIDIFDINRPSAV